MGKGLDTGGTAAGPFSTGLPQAENLKRRRLKPAVYTKRVQARKGFSVPHSTTQHYPRPLFF